MNGSILKSLSQYDDKISSPFLHPHQVATIDYLIKMIKQDKNILMYHLMGTGKTFTAAITASLTLLLGKKTTIITTNESTKEMFEEVLKMIFLWIRVPSTKDFVDIKSKDNIHRSISQQEMTHDYFEDRVVFIDEAHHWIDNKATSFLLELNQIEKPPILILMTGSPLTNTVASFISLANILLREDLNKNDFLIKGKRVIDIELKKAIYEIIDQVRPQITYYAQEAKNVPPMRLHGKPIIQLPFIAIPMGKLQSRVYNIIARDLENKMFKKELLSHSFALTGSLTPNDIKSSISKQITSTLSFSNGHFRGSELRNLNESTKIQFMMKNFIINPAKGKSFIYFENATIGGQFILDVMSEYKITEFGQQPVEGFHCQLCGAKRTCKTCYPMRFIMINSYHTTKTSSISDINGLLDAFNAPSNDDGINISIIFASKMIAESRTLKEVKRTILLTIPSAFSELSQILTRCIRVFSHKDTKTPFEVFVLASIPRNTNIDEFYTENNTSITSIEKLENSYATKKYLLDKYKDKLHLIDESTAVQSENILQDIDILELERNMKPDKPNNNFPYDVEKIIYLEIKSGATNFVLSKLRDIPYYYDSIQEEVEPIFIWEVLKRVAFRNIDFGFDALQKSLEIISNESLYQNLQKIMSEQPIVINKKLGTSFLTMTQDEYENLLESKSQVNGKLPSYLPQGLPEHFRQDSTQGLPEDLLANNSSQQLQTNIKANQRLKSTHFKTIPFFVNFDRYVISLPIESFNREAE